MDNWELATLPEEVLQHWRQIFLTKGQVPYQDPNVINAISKSCKNPIIITLEQDSETFLLCAFQKAREKNVAISLTQGSLCLSNRTNRDIERLSNLFEYSLTVLNAKGLYFPLLYDDDISAQLFSESSEASIWWRRDCPVIHWNEGGINIWPCCIQRLGTRALRRKRCFEKGKFIVSWADPAEAAYALSQIEKQSWKAQLQQDMFYRGQFDFYSRLLREGIIKARVVWDGVTPIAFRLDYDAIKGRIYCMKWSHAESHRRFSPGFFLIANDLRASWENREIDFVDLYGSPDHLKASVQTGVRRRYDFGWRGGSEMQQIREERLMFDHRLEKNYRSGNGIRRAY